MIPVYLFDLDGTLFNGDHRLHHIQKEPKDWATYFSLCGDDAPIPHIVRLAQDLARSRTDIVYVSGRSDECRKQTESCIFRHDLPFAPLYMRRQGDHRNDDIIKLELLEQIRRDGYEPIMAFDDRDRVVRALREAGLPVAQVAPGDF